jgi:hypothetical protein
MQASHFWSLLKLHFSSSKDYKEKNKWLATRQIQTLRIAVD